MKDSLPKHKKLIFTGPIDAFYASQGMEKLEYRSIYFEVWLCINISITFLSHLARKAVQISLDSVNFIAD